MPPLILRVAVPSPLRRTFDYIAPAATNAPSLEPGMRLRVPFGRRSVVGILVQVVNHTDVPPARLKAAIEVLDDRPLVPAELMHLAQWAGDYYQHPPGEVMAQLLPPLLRRGRSPAAAPQRRWQPTPAGLAADPAALRTAPRQAAVLACLQRHPDGIAREQLAGETRGITAALKALQAKGWAEICDGTAPASDRDAAPTPPLSLSLSLSLNADQEAAAAAVRQAMGSFQAFLLDGVTGSGKTEVYLAVIEAVIAAGHQALVLLPEIGLTPQMIARFRDRLHAPVAVYHSALSDGERAGAWTDAAAGKAAVVLGTRSAVFIPLARPGVYIIDEEHDPSYKQQDGFRYHARDLAVLRAQRAAVPVVLGTATPSIESLYNVERGRYRRLVLPQRAGGAVHPRLRLLDIRSRRLNSGMSETLLAAMADHLERDDQVLVFINRRGYAPTVLCHDCGWVARCRRCDAHLVMHQADNVLRCHHCGAEQPAAVQCPECGSSGVRILGQGTERIEQALQQRFPDYPVLRIDRDTTRRKGAMQALLERAHGGGAMILIGTQMLAKGHHLPDVTLVGVLNADAGLFSADFRAPERLAQTIIQVAGRAGRSDKPGTVVIQTHHPEHPLMQAMVNQGYHAVAAGLLEERRHAELPPYSCMALLRAESTRESAPDEFLTAARDGAEKIAAAHVQLLGPVPAPMARRAGRYRAHLLIQAGQRRHLHRLLAAWVPLLEELPAARKVRWSLDVDPMELL